MDDLLGQGMRKETFVPCRGRSTAAKLILNQPCSSTLQSGGLPTASG